MSQTSHRTRLVLDLRAVPLPVLTESLTDAGDIACAIVPSGNAVEIGDLVKALQQAGVAVLLEDDASLARKLGADGVHLAPLADLPAAYESARKTLGSDSIVGVEAGGDRHVAMVLGEAGADYVAFRLPEEREDVLWWAEVFEVPSIAMGAGSPEEAGVLARQGVEFISVSADVDTIGAFEAAVTETDMAKV